MSPLLAQVEAEEDHSNRCLRTLLLRNEDCTRQGAKAKTSSDAVRVALRAPWQRPGDILSLLLLVGGDVVQKALAQLMSVTFRPFGASLNIYVTPVAFSLQSTRRLGRLRPLELLLYRL